MDTVHWPQEEIVSQNTTNPCSKTLSNSSSLERRSRPQKDSAVNCPRCNSTNTKFCYYNNYSLTQPRYFCKTCRRYWTEGGTLRNVPVGGGSRKNKRSSSSSSSTSSVSSSYSSYNLSSNMSKKLPDLVVPHASTPVLSQNPRMHHEHGGQDLNLGFPSSNDFKTISELIQAPNFDNHGINTKNTNLELLNGITTTTTTRGSMMMNSFMPIPIPIPDSNSVYSSSGDDQLMIPIMPEFKIPSLNFSLDGSYGSGIGHENSSGRLLFPFEDLKTSTISTTTTTTTNTNDHEHHNAEHNRDQNGDTNGFWSGMLGGAGSW